MASSANATQARVRISGLAPVPTKDVVVNSVITTSFDLALTQRHEAALTNYIANLSNTGSPEYHRYLTPASYAATYGATSSEVAALRTYFARYGMSHTTLSAGRDILHVRGTTSEIARAFDAPVVTVRLSTGTLSAHFTSNGTLPTSIAKDVTAIAGLDTVVPLSTSLEPRPRSTVGHYAGHVPVGGLVDRHPAQQPGRLYRATAGRTLRTEHGVGQG